MSELFEPFLRHIRHDLAGPLPGKEAQMGMAPLFRARSGESYDTVREDARRGECWRSSTRSATSCTSP